MTAKIAMDEDLLRRLAADPGMTLRMLADRMHCSIACVLDRVSMLGIERPRARKRLAFTKHTVGLNPNASPLDGTKERQAELRETAPWPMNIQFQDAKVPREQCLGRISTRAPDTSNSSAGWTADAA